MSLLDALRAGVVVANKVTKSLQPQVEYHRYVGQTGTGTRTYDPPIGVRTTLLDAIVDWKSHSLRTVTGELTVSRASILLLDVDQVVAATGGAGIDDNDIFFLPDGTTGPILDMGGFIDKGTGHPLATEIYLG